MNLYRFGILTSLVIGLAANNPIAVGKAAAPAPKVKTNKEKIVGTWEVAKYPNGREPDGTTEFTKDGKVRVITKDNRTEEAAYELDGDKLTIRFTYPDGQPGKRTVTIVKLTEKEFHIKDEGGVIEFKRMK